MTTTTWTVGPLDCAPHEGDHTNCVKVVHWQCTGTDGEFTGSVYATCSLPEPIADYIPYEDLTLEQVLGWMWENGVDKEATEAAVLAQIETLKNPPIIRPPLPWSNVPTEPEEEA
jgi:hypothetical protein